MCPILRARDPTVRPSTQSIRKVSSSVVLSFQVSDFSKCRAFFSELVCTEYTRTPAKETSLFLRAFLETQPSFRRVLDTALLRAKGWTSLLRLVGTDLMQLAEGVCVSHSLDCHPRWKDLACLPLGRAFLAGSSKVIPSFSRASLVESRAQELENGFARVAEVEKGATPPSLQRRFISRSCAFHRTQKVLHDAFTRCLKGGQGSRIVQHPRVTVVCACALPSRRTTLHAFIAAFVRGRRSAPGLPLSSLSLFHASINLCCAHVQDRHAGLSRV